jgi:hypothetical protein
MNVLRRRGWFQFTLSPKRRKETQMKKFGKYGLALACILSAVAVIVASASAQSAPPVIAIAMTNSNPLPPVSSFNMSTNLGVAPFTVAFTDTSINTPTSWSWSFGDGGASTLQNPSHTFTNIWRQTVTLTVSNAYGTSSCSRAIFQCFPCDAVYDWTNGTQGQIAAVASLKNSLVGGANAIGYFTVTNRDLPSTNLQGIIFTNLPGMTNGCPVVFSNGVIYSDFNTTNALAFSWTNDHEQFTFHFNRDCVVTNIVLLFYDSMPLSSNTWSSCIDEINIATTKDSPDLGMYCLNRNLGCNGPLLPGRQNDYHTGETCFPTTYSKLNGISKIYQYPNKLYRILMEENTNGSCILAEADPVTSTLIGFVTNYNGYERGRRFTAIADGHTSWEIYTNNGLGAASWTNLTSILAYHDVITINRPLTWSQVSNVVMFGP